MTRKMLKLLIIHPALAPYRIDEFNALSKLFDLEVVFIFENVWNHQFDQDKLLAQLQFKVSFLLKGPRYKGRVLRFGILKTIRRIKPDIILGFEYSFTTQYLILLKRLGLIHQAIGSTIDDSIEICNHVQSKGRYLVRKQTVRHLDYLVVLSNEVSQFYQEKFNLKDSQIIVSPILQNSERLRANAHDLEQIANDYVHKYNLKGKKVMLFVGRFIPEKALPEFINTIHALLTGQDDTVLVLVGDGETKPAVEAIIKEKQLEQSIILPGRYEGTSLYAWYLCASGFFMPSTYEPFGAVVNEALIFGLKVFCSRYAGASGLVGENGILFDPLKEEETLDKFIKFISLVDRVDDIQLNKKPSLMADHQTDFIKEWRKLMYV